MSGIASRLNAPSTAMDDVSITVGDQTWTPWQQIVISASCENLPRQFQLTGTPEFLSGPGALNGTRPGQACTIKIGNDVVITGWIDRRVMSAGPREHQIVLTGRGLTRNAVDCSIDLTDTTTKIKGGMINEPTLLSMAQDLCHSYGIKVVSNVADLGIPILGYQVHLQDSPFDAIERVARYAGYLVYENALGQMVLDRVGTRSHASGFTVPGNIEYIQSERSVADRFQTYYVTWMTVDSLGEFSPLTARIVPVIDPTFTEKRIKVIISEQIGSPVATEADGFRLGNLTAQQRGNWEMGRRYGRSQAVSLTCDSWRDSAGKLWEPNMLATIDAPAVDIANANWLIGSVAFRKDASGTHADIVMMDPLAFTPEPVPLNLFNNELAHTPLTSQNPAPASTTSPPK